MIAIALWKAFALNKTPCSARSGAPLIFILTFMGLQVLTTDDLEKFRVQLMNDIENLLNSKQPKKWLKTQEVMELLGISEVTLQNLRNRGQIPYRKLGGTCFYSAEEIDDFLTKSKYMKL